MNLKQDKQLSTTAINQTPDIFDIPVIDLGANQSTGIQDIPTQMEALPTQYTSNPIPTHISPGYIPVEYPDLLPGLSTIPFVSGIGTLPIQPPVAELKTYRPSWDTMKFGILLSEVEQELQALLELAQIDDTLETSDMVNPLKAILVKYKEIKKTLIDAGE